MKHSVSLRKRWLVNSLSIITALGLVCVFAVTAAFAVYYYANADADLRYRARTTTDFISGYVNLNYNDYYQNCLIYAQTYEDRDVLELQFIDADGRIVASSYGQWITQDPVTSDVQEALATRSIRTFSGKNPNTGERIMAVSSPLIYSNGEVIGVLRFVTSTRKLDQRIVLVGAISLLALGTILAVVLLSSSYYLRSILIPVIALTEKARRIASGSYGIRIEKQHSDEIGDLVDAINELSVKISQNEKTQSEFISSLSHELRTPLTAINGWSETLLSNDSLDEETRRGMKIISREANRLTEMVVELLDFTRIQDGRMTLNVESTDIRSEFEDTVYMYGSRLAQEGITLVCLDDDEEIPEIPCDPKRLRQVFLNILDNAAKHGGEGKRIEAAMSWENESVVVRIRDFGPGIPEDEIPLVKKKFYKGSSKARGSGIGLAVCDEIVEMHGGTLTLENAQGGGTLVTVRLPGKEGI